MNNKLLSIIAVFIGLVLPIKMQAQAWEEIYAPTFTFEGDNLVMTCETQGAIIYYSMSEFTNDDEAYDLADNMEVNEYTGTAYTEPIPVTKNVVIKAIAKMPQMQGGSDYKVLIYKYTSWKLLLDAIDYGNDVLNRAQNNPNVSEDLKDQLKWAVEEGQMIYGHRGEMPDSHEAEHFTEEILQIAHEIEELLDSTQTDPEPYAVLSDNNTVLTFYYDEKKAERNGMDVGPFSDYSQKRVWNNQSTSITTVVFDDSFANCTTLTSTAYWFYDFEKLTTITGISNLNTDNVINMTSMFQGCSSLTNLNISNLKTDNVTNMRCLFMDCSSLTNLDLSGFNTANVVYMEDMFAFCTSLQSLNLSSFNTEKVTGMASMFQTCINLTSLNVSSFKTDNVSDFRNMFNGCTGLTSLDVSSFKINADNLYSSNGMFAGCSNLKTIYGGDGWNEWKSSNDFVFDGSQMFSNCTALVGGAGTHYDPNHTDYTYAHIDGGTANPGYFTAAGAEPWKDIDAVVLTGKINNYWYDATGTNPDGDEAIIFTIPEVPEEGMEWEFSILGTFIQNQLAFTTADGEAIDNIIGDILFETKGNMVAIDDGRFLIYESENERGEIAMVDPNSGMIRIMGNEITLRLLNDPNSKFLALPLRVKAYYNNRDVTVTNGSFTVLVQSHKQVQEPEPYAVLSQNNTVLTFYYDDQKNQRNGMDIGPFEDVTGWFYFEDIITKVVFDSSFANCTTITSTAYWFIGLSNLTSIENLQYLNTSNVTSINQMFNGCSKLTSLDVTGFNTEKVTNMLGVFSGCRALTSLDVSGFNTSNVTTMASMFDGCSELTSLDVSGFNTEKVTDMGRMFIDCSSLTNLDVHNFKTSNVTNMSGMFAKCSNLTTLDVSSFNTENVTDIGAMFMGCSKLTILDLSTFITNKVTTVQTAFYDCSSLTILDLSNFNTGNVTDMYFMLGNCFNLTTVYANNEWSTTNVTRSTGMFSGCSKLVGGQGTRYDPNHIDAAYAHIDGGTVNPGYFTDKNAAEEADTEPYAIYEYSTLSFYYDNKKEERGGWRLMAINEDREWTPYAQEINTVVFDSSFAEFRPTSTASWFNDFSSLTTITGIANLKTDSVTDMSSMFYNCSSLQELDLSGFNTNKVTNISQMFFGCSSLMNINISNFNTSNVTSRNRLFSGCSSLASIQAGSANIPAEEYANVANPNLLVYVNEPSLAPEGIQNVVINGRAQEIILTDVTEGNNNWNCPEPFTAEKISYTRNFKQQTEVGISRGWESIALPFTVQTITHEVQGQIIPFGAQGNGKYFWLRGYSPEGLQRATVLEANTPYVISMPNNTVVYPYEYNLNGRVTFSAENTIVPATPEMDEMTITRGNITMSPIFRFLPQHERIYAINVGQPLDRYAEGSVFTRELREVRPFEAITIHDADINGARPRFIRIAAQPKYDITGIKTIENDSVEGPWYSLDGLQLQSQPQKKGVYIQNGKKVVIK